MVIALLLHVALSFAPGHRFAPLTLATAVAEADAIWSPHGVRVARGEPCGWQPEDIKRLTVVVESGQPTAGRKWGAPLGFVRFGPGGVPLPNITVIADDIVGLVSTARTLGVREWQWPREM